MGRTEEDEDCGFSQVFPNSFLTQPGVDDAGARFQIAVGRIARVEEDGVDSPNGEVE